MRVRRAVQRMLALLRAPRLDRELNDEILAHLEMAERDAVAAGLSPDEARRQARRRFGPVQAMREAHRDDRSARWLENLLKDVRYAAGSLFRDPTFTVVAVGILALGIGANAAMFSVVDAVLLKPLPFPDPDRIVRVWEAPRPGATNATSAPDFDDWRRLATSFDAVAAEQWVSAALTGAGEPRRLRGKAVTADYFTVFGATLRFGRSFTPDDDQPGADPAVVLSYTAWQTYFGGDPDILQRRPVFDGTPQRVLGVLAPGAFGRNAAEFWKPLALRPADHPRSFHWLTVHARLREGVTVAQAREEMHGIDAALVDVTPAYKQDWTIEVEPLDALLVGDGLRQSLVVAFGAVGVVLLIACANVTNLLLARGVARRKEMAIRAALGASRGRLLAQLLTESFVLCLLGGAVGLCLAVLMVDAVNPMIDSVPHAAEVALDLRVLGFAASVALCVALLIGTLPALHTSAGSLSKSLGESGRGSSAGRARLRRAIVVAEVALSLVLVTGAALLFRSLDNLQRLETGIRIDHVVTLAADLPLQAYATPERAVTFYEAVIAHVEGVPGVRRAALSSHLPLQWIGNGEGLQVAGLAEMVNVRFKRVDPGYFAALDIPLVAGRGITEEDRAGGRRVVVINQALAARLAEAAGMTNPVGQTVRLGCPRYATTGVDMADVEIVGIIRSERVSGPGRPDPPVVYVPIGQVPRTDFRLLVRTDLEPAAVVSGIREAIRRVDPNLPLGDIATMQEVRDRTLSGFSRPAWVIGAFAVVAALLTALGLYGVLAHSVTQRRREIGIRMALGARAPDVLKQVLTSAMALVGVGLVLGLAGAFAVRRILGTLLFEISPLDPGALVLASVVMAAIGLIAALLPAGRAARVQPIAVLREEG